MAHKSKDKVDCVSLDLFVGDEDDEPHSSSQNAVETLCLRILSKRGINYRFGGLQLHVKSPDFHIGKSFHVNLDENNKIHSIESYREPEDAYLFGRRRVSLLGSNNLGTSPARILITPKKPPESEASSGATNSVQAGEPTNGTAATNRTATASKSVPILTADVVVEEIRQPEKTISENAGQPGQSLGSALVNTLLNKRTNNHSSTSSLANSSANSPSQSIHSINSLSSSMLELRTSSPIDPASSSPEKLISKLTLQAFGHLDKESKYIKNKKNKKYDFKKRSKERLLKNGEKNQENGSGQQTGSAGAKSAPADKKAENCKQPDCRSVPVREERRQGERASEKPIEKVKEKVNNKCDKKLASDHNLSIESAKKNSAVQTKSIGVCTHLDASCLSLNLNQDGFFFFNLRRTRSWKK